MMGDSIIDSVHIDFVGFNSCECVANRRGSIAIELVREIDEW